MTGFVTLKRRCMDAYERNVQPFLSDGRTGHIWSGRFNLIGLIEFIDDWMDENGMDIEAVALRDAFKAMPAAKYSCHQCIAGLNEETARWNAGRPA
jgi:hypothetical protein